MSWKDLNGEIAELFGELTTRNDEMIAAMDRQMAMSRAAEAERQRIAYRKRKCDTQRQRAFRARQNEWKRNRYWADPETERLVNREKQSAYRARVRAARPPKAHPVDKLEPQDLAVLVDASISVKGAMLRTRLAYRTVQRYREELRRRGLISVDGRQAA